MMMDEHTDIGEKNNFRAGAYLSPFAVIALSFGYAVGWGAFVLPGASFLPNAGPAGTIIGFLIGTAAIAVLAFNFHKVTISIQGTGGVYGFITKVFGYNNGFLIGWFLLLTYASILWANATSLVLLARCFFGDALQFGFHYTVVGFDIYFGEALLSIAAIVFCGFACIFGKRFAIRLNTFFAVMLIVGVLTCFTAAVFKHTGGTASMAPAFSPTSPAWVQILRVLAIVPWAFVGFEAVIQSSSEFRFPLRRTFPLLLAAILLSALIYIILVLFPILVLPEGYSNWYEYLDALPDNSDGAAVPVFLAAQNVLGPLGEVVIGGAMLSAQLTAIFATYIAVSRIIRAMADDAMFPQWFGKCNREGTPVNATLIVMLVSLAPPFLGRMVTGWAVELANFGIAVAYGYTSAAVLQLHKKEGTGGRLAEKVAGVFGLAMSIVFGLLMLVPNYLSGSSLSTGSYLLLAIWCFIGFIPYRRVFIMDTQDRFGHSIVVWIAVLIIIFFSSLMWFRLAICDAGEDAMEHLVGQTITEESVQLSVIRMNIDILFESLIELSILVASLAVILNLIMILHRREDNLVMAKLEAEKSANQSKSYFFSTISHDIRTPLNAIIGYSQMLKMGFMREDERGQAFDSVINGGRTLLRIIDDAIDFAKLEDGQLEFEEEPTDCAKLLLGFMDSFRRTKQTPAVEFRCLPEQMPTLLLDPKRVRQILFNLVDNAAKFTKKGFVEVRASFKPAAKGGTGTLRIAVEDTGCGIGGEDLKLITTPYVQVASEHARHGGTGIGLAVCRMLVEAMKGELSIASTLGKGSTFTVTLRDVKVTNEKAINVVTERESPPAVPEIPAPETPAPETPAPETPAPESPRAEAASEAKEETPAETAAPKRILVVDDQKVNLLVLKTMLKKLGTFDVVTAENGQEALKLLTAADVPFDLVLTDMWMPVMDGEGLVQAVRADGKLASLPVHVVTADTELDGKFEEIGFDGMLLKPVTVEKLRGILTHATEVNHNA